MRWKNFIQLAVSSGFSLARKPFPVPQGLRVLTFHSVGSAAFGDLLGLNTLPIERFREHLDVLAELATVPLSPLAISNDHLRVAITFDDGYANNLHVAAPLLAERGIPYSVFVTSDFVRNQVDGFLSPTELKQLAQSPGATIGAHGRSHCRLTQCSNVELRAELEDSKHFLEDLLGQPVTSLAYPYGATDMRVRYAAQCAGFDIGVCCRFDVNRIGRDRLMLNRCVILNNDTPRVLRQKVYGGWDWYKYRNVDPLLVEGTET